ncbi:hypothetical protein M0R45_008867 [Rubus argutus]|uniref:Uncharacterized protein n=1 Tax=Rubus argutus TaxID=59490 RepID=A0AAW1Y2F0_RUBAR
MDGFDDDLGIQLSIDAVRWLWLGRGLNGGLREGYGDAGGRERVNRGGKRRSSNRERQRENWGIDCEGSRWLIVVCGGVSLDVSCYE